MPGNGYKGGIRFGLAAVKNVGLKAVESVIEERNQDGPFKDLLDFCKRVDGSKVNRRVLEGLIQCGAFDFTRLQRARLYGALDEVIRFCGACHDPNQMNMFASLGGDDAAANGLLQLPDLEEWDEKEKLRKEKEALGFYITGHPLDRFKTVVKDFATCAIEGLTNLRDKTPVKVAGVIENLRIKRTKRGDKMAILSLEDPTGSTEVILFPDVFSNYSVLLKGDEPLLIGGTAEVDGNAAKIIAQEMETLETVRQRTIKAVELRLHLQRVSREVLEQIRDIFFRFPGECSVLFRVDAGQGKELLIEANDHYRISPCDEATGEIEAIIGAKIAFRYGGKRAYASPSQHP
jgi:DNA polymerase-3 subunit alpha